MSISELGNPPGTSSPLCRRRESQNSEMMAGLDSRSESDATLISAHMKENQNCPHLFFDDSRLFDLTAME
jgi:hypothetical protein